MKFLDWLREKFRGKKKTGDVNELFITLIDHYVTNGLVSKSKFYLLYASGNQVTLTESTAASIIEQIRLNIGSLDPKYIKYLKQCAILNTKFPADFYKLVKEVKG